LIGKQLPLMRVVAGLIHVDGKILIQQRPAHSDWAGFWEFPGGKIECDESPAEALSRELDEELGIVVDQASFMFTINEQRPDKHLELGFWQVEVYSGKLVAKESQNLLWVDPQQLAQLAMPPADLQALPAIFQSLSICLA